MSTTTQQRQGAQQAAAAQVRSTQGEFQQRLNVLLGQADALRPEYQGPAANAFFVLVGSWLEDAGSIVRDMERFASRLDAQETTVTAQQDESAAGFSRTAVRLATTFA